MQVFPPGESGKEAGEGSFVGDRPDNSADLGNERIVFQGTDECPSRRQAKHVLGDEAMPEGSGGMSLGASAGWANQSIEESAIIQPVEKGLKLTDDRRWLNQYRNSGIINVGHGKMRPSLWLGAVGVSRTCGPALFTNKCTTTRYKRQARSVTNDERTPPVCYECWRNTQ